MNEALLWACEDNCALMSPYDLRRPFNNHSFKLATVSFAGGSLMLRSHCSCRILRRSGKGIPERFHEGAGAAEQVQSVMKKPCFSWFTHLVHLAGRVSICGNSQSRVQGCGRKIEKKEERGEQEKREKRI